MAKGEACGCGRKAAETARVFECPTVERFADVYPFGETTISDVTGYLHDAYFLPGNFVIEWIWGFEFVGRFFEMPCPPVDAMAAGILSAIVWVLALSLLGAISD